MWAVEGFDLSGAANDSLYRGQPVAGHVKLFQVRKHYKIWNVVEIESDQGEHGQMGNLAGDDFVHVERRSAWVAVFDFVIFVLLRLSRTGSKLVTLVVQAVVEDQRREGSRLGNVLHLHHVLGQQIVLAAQRVLSPVVRLLVNRLRVLIWFRIPLIHTV